MNSINSPASGNQINPTGGGFASSLANYRAKVRARPRFAPPTRFWGFVVFAWAVITTLLISQAISSSVPMPAPSVEGRDALPVLIWKFAGIWIVGTTLAFGIAFVRRKRFRRVLLRPLNIFSTLLTVFFGWFMGTNIYAMSFLDHHASAVSAAFHDYPQVNERMKVWSYLPDDQKSVWFDEQGQLLPDQKQAWCANAVPRALTFSDMSTNPGREGVAINALLAQGMLTQLYTLGCLETSEHIRYMHELHDKTKHSGRQQQIMAKMGKMGWFSPVFHYASMAEPMVAERTIYSPARACQVMSKSTDVVKINAACQKLPQDRPLTDADLPIIEQTLSQLG